MPCKGVHQTHALQVCDLSYPGPTIRLFLGLLLPKNSYWELPEWTFLITRDGTQGRETKCFITSSSFTGKAGDRTAGKGCSPTVL